MQADHAQPPVMECLDSGKPILDCGTVDVVGAVLPWNFPPLRLASRIGPALAAGNVVRVKPVGQTSLPALRVAELAHAAVVSRGVLKVLAGDGPSVGGSLGRHGDVDMASFTGATDTGRRFLHDAADSNLRTIVPDWGGRNGGRDPAVLFDDAENRDHAAEHVVTAAFWNAGQICSAISRSIGHRDPKSASMAWIAARLRDWKTGDPLDPANRIGGLIDAGHCERVRACLDPGDRGDDLIAPVIRDVARRDPRARDQIFGPARR